MRDPVLPAEEEVVPTLPGPQLESSEDSIPPGSKDTRSQKPSVRNNWINVQMCKKLFISVMYVEKRTSGQ